MRLFTKPLTVFLICVLGLLNGYGVMHLPAIPGTCTSTGYQSDGTLSLVTTHQGQKGGDQGAKGNVHASPSEGGHHDVSVNGGYSTSWTSPALAFLSFSSAIVVPVPSTPDE